MLLAVVGLYSHCVGGVALPWFDSGMRPLLTRYAPTVLYAPAVHSVLLQTCDDESSESDHWELLALVQIFLACQYLLPQACPMPQAARHVKTIIRRRSCGQRRLYLHTTGRQGSQLNGDSSLLPIPSTLYGNEVHCEAQCRG